MRAGGANSPDGAVWPATLETWAATRAGLAGGALGTGGAVAAGASGSRRSGSGGWFSHGWFSRDSGSWAWDSRA